MAFAYWHVDNYCMHMFHTVLISWLGSRVFLFFYIYIKQKGENLGCFLYWHYLLLGHLPTAKIITEPIPFAMVFLFSFPLTLIHLPAYLIWDKFKNHKNAMFVFPNYIYYFRMATIYIYAICKLGRCREYANT